MCGIAGFTGMREKRIELVRSLGYGIDGRGGHASGFATVGDDGRIVSHRKLGHWTGARARFVGAAASGPHVMMHARYATAGLASDVRNAHPFRVVRGERVLWGSHNGMVPGASMTARSNGRPYTVDSKEVFELLADEQEDLIEDLDGYGVLTWIEKGAEGIFICKASDCGQLSVVRVPGAGVIYASTDAILYGALGDCDILPEHEYRIETGRVYFADEEGLHETDRTEIRFADMWGGYGKGLASLDDDFLKELEKDDAEHDFARDKDDPFYWKGEGWINQW